MAYTTIDDPSAHFQTVLYSGNGSTQSITNDGNSDLQPDWLWFKNRNDTQVHQLFDTNRGIANSLRSNGNDAENTDSPNDRLTAINSDGFSLGDDGNPNNGSNTYVCWQWKANGGTTSSDSNGDQTSTVQANTTAGFSIATFSASDSAGQTVGHGLGSAPHMYIWKSRARADNWYVYHREAGENGYLRLNTTDAFTTNTNVWSNTDPSSTVIYYGGNSLVGSNGENHVLYSFAPIQGFSKMGKYTGNGDADGPFTYTGFEPAWIMLKRSDNSTNSDWTIYDHKRPATTTGNENNKFLRANGDNAEASASGIDILSNGFKMRSTSSRHNANGSTYIYMAFALHPLVSSEGVPTTAR